jgi:hypothetical protein
MRETHWPAKRIPKFRLRTNARFILSPFWGATADWPHFDSRVVTNICQPYGLKNIGRLFGHGGRTSLAALSMGSRFARERGSRGGRPAGARYPVPAESFSRRTDREDDIGRHVQAGDTLQRLATKRHPHTQVFVSAGPWTSPAMRSWDRSRGRRRTLRYRTQLLHDGRDGASEGKSDDPATV